LPGDALPPVDAPGCGRGKVSIGAARDDGDDPRDPEFRAFLDRPLHAVEFEDGEKQGDLEQGGSCDFFSQVKLDSIFGYGGDAAAANPVAGGDVKVLSDPRSKDADQVIGMLSDESSAVSGDFVGNPAAARHVR
jgi:hypothetical protein